MLLMRIPMNLACHYVERVCWNPRSCTAKQGLEVLLLNNRVLDADALAGFSAAAPWLWEVELHECSLREGDTSALCSFLEGLQTATLIALTLMEGSDTAAPLLQSISHLGAHLQKAGRSGAALFHICTRGCMWLSPRPPTYSNLGRVGLSQPCRLTEAAVVTGAPPCCLTEAAVTGNRRAGVLPSGLDAAMVGCEQASGSWAHLDAEWRRAVALQPPTQGW